MNVVESFIIVCGYIAVGVVVLLILGMLLDLVWAKWRDR